MPALSKEAGAIVCNAGPLIALAGIKQLTLFQRKVTGTGGILLIAKRAGLVREVGPLMQQMHANGYFLSARLVEGICQAAGE
jgi:predicted nucleic acid-binding protein